MQEAIKKSDLVTGSPFEEIGREISSTLGILEKFDGELKSIAKTMNGELATAQKKTIQDINAINQAEIESEKLVQAKIRTSKLQLDLQAKQNQLNAQSKKQTEQQARALEKETREKEKANKQSERAAKLAKDEASAYKQLERNTRDLKNQSKELGAQMLQLEMAGKKNTAEYRKLSTIFNDVTKKAQQGDIQLKKLDKTVGDNFRNVGNYEGAINKISAGLSTLGISVGVGAVLKSGAEAIINFNQQVADLQAITGAGGKDLEFFSEQANKLGLSVEGGASAVVEAYKLIGSAKPELLENAQALDQVAQSAITLSQASGMTLQDSATALTDAMNQFGASAEDADKFVNVLANGAKFGSAEIPQITEALLKFGAVAKSTGTSVEESTAMIELLAEKGLKGAEAGTALRNVMLKLSAPDALPREAKKRLDELGISLTDLANPALTITEKLKMLSPLMKDNGALIKTFGVENATSALALIQNTQRIDELNKSMSVNGTAIEQANQRTNTLGHALMELKNSFLGLFTQMGGGSGAMQNIIDSFKYLGANLGSIISIVGKVIRTWLIYKGTLKAIQAQQWIANGGFKELGSTLLKNIPYTRAYRLEQLTLARAQKGVGESATSSAGAMKSAGNTMKAIPWVLIISSLVELYNWWMNVASASAQARRQADLTRQAQEAGANKAMNLSTKTREAYDEEVRKNELVYRTRIANSKSAADKAKLEKQMAEENIKIQNKYVNNEKKRKTTAEENLKMMEKSLKAIKTQKANLSDFSSVPADIAKEYSKAVKYLEQFGFKQSQVSGREADQVIKMIETQKAQIKQSKEDIKTFQDIADESNVSLLEASQTQEDYSVKINKTTESYKGAKDSAQEYTTTLGEVNDYMQESINLMQQLEEIFQNRAVAKLTDEIDALVEKIKTEAESGKGVFGITLKVAKSPEDEKETDKANLDLLLSSNTELNAKIEERFQLEKKNLEQRNQFAKNQIDMDNELAQETELNHLLEERNKLIQQEGISSADKAKIEEDYQEKLNDLAIENAQRDEDARLKKLLLDEKLTDDEKKLDEDKVKSKEDANKKILDGDKQFQKDQSDINKANKDVDSIKERYDLIQDIQQATTNALKEEIDKRIDLLQKESDAAKNQQDYLQNLAAQGNIYAQQSISEQIQIQRDAQAEQMRLEKQKQSIELISTGLKTFESALSEGKSPGEALASTIVSTTVLTSFLKNLQFYEKGTMNAPGGLSVVDEKGQEMITDKLGNIKELGTGKGARYTMLNKGDKVYTATQTASMLSAFDNHGNASKLSKMDKTGTSFDLMNMTKEIKVLQDIVQNKSETNIAWQSFASGINEIVQTKHANGVISRNRFRIN
jgi:TP901 family phage tail tape measure protein